MVSGNDGAFPIVHALPGNLDASTIFRRISDWPGCIWLDSSTSELADRDDSLPHGRYSFLSADPVQRFDAQAGDLPAADVSARKDHSDENPWDRLAALAKILPTSSDESLPPFQGGLAGVIGYEAGASLESVGVSVHNDLPTPAMSIGLYDWTIAIDHHTGKRWIISQGLDASNDIGDDTQARSQRARERIRVVLERLGQSASTHAIDHQTPPESPTPRIFPRHATHLDGLTSNFTSEHFRETVGEIVSRIRAGDCFQVNLAQRLVRAADCSSPELYLRLRKSNPAPLSGYYDGGSFQVISSSPESFVCVRGDRVETRPIKGTVPRTGDPTRDQALAVQLSNSEKDHAENVMIVDLMRNDLSRVCTDDSVRVEKLCQIERYQFVQHLVSVVSGRLRDDQGVVDLLRACFPGGSVTGAPKIEAMKTIAELEPNPRGPYCGSMGYISCGGAADFNILIRTITATRGHWQIPVGGGITARSQPESEEAETWAKAEGMLRAVSAGSNPPPKS